MGRLLRNLAFAALAVGLSDCAARNIASLQMKQAGDEALDCPALLQQIAANRAAADSLLRKDKDVENANTAKVIGSAVVPYVGPLIMASADLSNEEQVQARAAADRNDWLLYLARQKGCKNA